MFDRWRNRNATAQRLMLYWDEVLEGASPAQPALDATLTTAVHQIHARDGAPPIDPGFSTRLLEELTSTVYGSWSDQSETLPVAVAHSIPANGLARPMRSAPTDTASRRGRERFALASAALMLVLIAGLIAALFALSSRDDEDLPPVPAIIEGSPAATPAPDLVSQTLFEQHFDAGELHLTDDDFFIWNRYSIAPGMALEYPNACGAPKLVISFVESGVYTVRAKGQMQVTRGGMTETVPPETEVMLAAGDSLLYRNESGDRFTGFSNAGPDPLVVTEAIWRLNECVEGPPENMEVMWDSYDYAPAIDPGRPLSITLRRITAQPGVILSEEGPHAAGWLPSSDRALERIYVEAGNLELIQFDLNDEGTPNAQSVYQYPEGRTGIGGTFTLDLDMNPPETTFHLDNSGDVPLVITVFTVAYEGGESTGATPSDAEP
jgi:hypothetical protein